MLPCLVQPNDMPAELSLNRIGNLANFKRNRCSFERRHHHARPEPAKFTAIGSGWTGGFLTCRCREIGAPVQVGFHGFGFFFRFKQNMRGVVLFLRIYIAVLRIISRLKLFIRYSRHQRGVECFARLERSFLILQRQLNDTWQTVHLEGQCLLLDQLL